MSVNNGAAPATSAPAATATTETTPKQETEKSLLDAPAGTPEGAKGEEGKTLLDSVGDAEAPKGADAKPNESGEKKPNETKEQKPDGAPEKYGDFKLPEGMTLDTAMAEEFKTVAKSLNLSQEKAQSLVDLQAKYAKAQEQAIQAQYKQTVDNWKKETIQALGADYQKELGFAAKARDRFGSPELKQLLNDTGLANNKEVISFFIKIGKEISEDSFVDGKPGSGAEKSLAQTLYPTMK